MFDQLSGNLLYSRPSVGNPIEMPDPREIASQIVDATLIETRTWSTEEVRQMMNEAIEAAIAACAKIAQEFSWPGGMNGMELYLRDSIAKAILARGKASVP
jgi:hypothetical protein